MEKLAGDASRRPVPRSFKAMGLIIAGFILFGSPAICPAETPPFNLSRTNGADKTAAEPGKSLLADDAKLAATKDDISRTITSYCKDIQDASNRELLHNPKIDGEITVSFTVQPGGDVADVKAEKSSLNWPPLQEEILNRVKTWKFSPYEGEPIPATVPYKFGPK